MPMKFNPTPVSIVKQLVSQGYEAYIVGGAVRDLLLGHQPKDYDMIVFYNPADVKSLQENFPDFQQGDIKMVSYGRSIVKAMEEAGLRIDVKAPSPEAPSVARAIELYLESL